MNNTQPDWKWRIVLALAICTYPLAAHAGGGGVGATEVTQIMNHAELVASVAKQAQMVEQNIEAQIVRLQNLAQMSPQVLSGATTPYRAQMGSLQSLYTSVSGLRQAAEQTNDLFSRSMSEMSNTGMTPSQWLSAYSKLATTRGGYYRQQLDSDMNSLSILAQRAQNLQQVQSLIPGISGNVQGLQLLNQQTGLLAGEMLDMHALMQRQLTQRMQEREAVAQGQVNAARLAAARQVEARLLNELEVKDINSEPPFELLKSRN
ncbi:conjugal transfer protein TrbJ [Paraburkholderia humisilvae]|uniref:P-type conjugative transfer protein TrbJ n=1 Tax=Paraburkholderia humisilvae TaxID=627669 RepID=A0A6J5EXM9_9BURK|nr:conjugal transfer protein TrbJ [Paraburkholderia humisilvae]CAB3770824.1 hypothetical protein LMG29542_06452 [Paraburkholderia humisilvae]